MDPAIFIRKKSIMALWLVVPVILITGTIMVSQSILENQKSAYIQYTALERLIPDMKTGLAAFNKFISVYQIDPDAILSVENEQNTALNEAAQHVDFTITSINFTQDPPEKTPKGTIRVNIRIKGLGSCRGISAFLNNIHAQDRLAYEKRIQIMPGAEDGGFILEAELGRVYAERKGFVQ